MKKITLLLVAAVFAIGIQSCSTDEIGIEEETKQENVEMKLGDFTLNGHCVDCVTVYYPESMPFWERDEFRNLMRQNVFSTLIQDGSNSCGNKESWLFTGYDENLFKASGIIFPGGHKVVEVEPDGEETAKYFMGTYTYRVYGVINQPEVCNNDSNIFN